MGPVAGSKAKIDTCPGTSKCVRVKTSIFQRFPDQLQEQAVGRVEGLRFGTWQAISGERKSGQNLVRDEPESAWKIGGRGDSPSGVWGRGIGAVNATQGLYEFIQGQDVTRDTTGDPNDGV